MRMWHESRFTCFLFCFCFFTETEEINYCTQTQILLSLSTSAPPTSIIGCIFFPGFSSRWNEWMITVKVFSGFFFWKISCENRNQEYWIHIHYWRYSHSGFFLLIAAHSLWFAQTIHVQRGHFARMKFAISCGFLLFFRAFYVFFFSRRNMRSRFILMHVLCLLSWSHVAQHSHQSHNKTF